MTILAIDTTSQWCSVAIFIDKNNYFYQHKLLGNSASQHVLDFVQAVLDQAKLSLEDISVFACSQGPGAFTGIRLGIGVSQGLAFAHSKPLIPITSLDGMVAYERLIHPDLFQFDRFTVAIDARMNQIYRSEYHLEKNMIPVRTGPIYLQNHSLQMQPVHDFAITYDCSQYESFRSCFKQVVESAPHALGIAYQASFVNPNATFDPEDCQPLYIRDKVAQTTLERSHSNLV